MLYCVTITCHVTFQFQGKLFALCVCVCEQLSQICCMKMEREGVKLATS